MLSYSQSLTKCLFILSERFSTWKWMSLKIKSESEKGSQSVYWLSWTNTEHNDCIEPSWKFFLTMIFFAENFPLSVDRNCKKKVLGAFMFARWAGGFILISSSHLKNNFFQTGQIIVFLSTKNFFNVLKTT